tara:strand:- start:3332 stop:3994 length:663 start_codon:yes stop_codon:yes gene_type:complete
MRTHCIQINHIPESVEAAKKCIASGSVFGVDVQPWSAKTPQDDPEAHFISRGWRTDKFVNKWSNFEPCLATFWSHYSLWEACSKQDDMFLILEHDSIIHGPIPDMDQNERIVCNVSKPSFGKFHFPSKGIGKFRSGPQGFFKGLHGYLISPSGAKALTLEAHNAEPADVYVNLTRFPWLQETYPWSVEARSDFSTIQKEAGCVAHHQKVTPLVMADPPGR